MGMMSSFVKSVGKIPITLTKENDIYDGKYVWQNAIESIPKQTIDLIEDAGRYFTNTYGKNELSPTGRYSTNLLTRQTAPYATGGNGVAKFGVTNPGEGIHDTWARTHGLDFVEDSSNAWNVHNAYHEWLHSKMKGVREETVQKEAIQATKDYFSNISKGMAAMASQQALQEPDWNPLDLIGPGGGLMSMGSNALMNYFTGK